MAREKEKRKTNHQIGYRKKQKNPTTNFDGIEGKHDFYSHGNFCKRCLNFNRRCPRTGNTFPDPECRA